MSVTDILNQYIAELGCSAKELANASGLSEASVSRYRTADGQSYTEAIRWAQANGIVKGYNAEQFGPNDPITREQMAAILYRYAVYKGYDVSARADLTKFADSGRISAWATENVAWANATGLLNGISKTAFDPQGCTSREQVAAILHRFCDNIKK